MVEDIKNKYVLFIVTSFLWIQSGAEYTNSLVLLVLVIFVVQCYKDEPNHFLRVDYCMEAYSWVVHDYYSCRCPNIMVIALNRFRHFTSGECYCSFGTYISRRSSHRSKHAFGDSESGKTIKWPLCQARNNKGYAYDNRPIHRKRYLHIKPMYKRRCWMDKCIIHKYYLCRGYVIVFALWPYKD